MIQFACPNCDKPLRADDSKSGATAKCPGCGHRFTIPSDEPEPAAAEESEEQEEEEQEEEQERPAPRKKKRKLRRKATEADRGRRYVIIIAGIVLGMHFLGLLSYLATPDPSAAAQKLTQELMKDVGKDLPEESKKKLDQDLKQMSGGPEMQETLRRTKLMGLAWLIGGFALHAILLTCLYLQQDWARVVLGVLFLLGGFCGLAGVVFGGLFVLRLFSTGVAILAGVEMLVRLGVNFGIGIALMKSESIAAYTAGR